MIRSLIWLFMIPLAWAELPKKPSTTLSVWSVMPSVHTEQMREVGTVTRSINPTIYAEVDGKIEKLRKHSGQTVNLGDVITSINEQAAKGAFIRAQSDWMFKRQILDKHRVLLERNRIAQTQYDQVENDYYQSLGEAMIMSHYYQKSQVTAPCQGQLGVIQVTPGTFVQSGAALMNIDCFEPDIVDFYIPVSQMHHIEKNAFEVQALSSSKLIPASLVAIDPVVQQKNQKVLVRIRLDQFAEIKPNQLVTVIGKRLKPSAIYIPITAVETVDDQHFVYQVRSDQDIKRSAISIGEIYKDQVEVTQGLQSGDQIIQSGWSLWKPGQPVNLVKLT